MDTILQQLEYLQTIEKAPDRYSERNVLLLTLIASMSCPLLAGKINWNSVHQYTIP